MIKALFITYLLVVNAVIAKLAVNLRINKMNNSQGQISVKEFLTARYDGKLEDSELLEGKNSVYEFFSILSEIAQEQNITNAGYDSANAGATSI